MCACCRLYANDGNINYFKSFQCCCFCFVAVPIAPVRGVLGRQAMLPCDINPLEQGDVVFMVLWYREGDNEPLYKWVLLFNSLWKWHSQWVWWGRVCARKTRTNTTCIADSCQHNDSREHCRDDTHRKKENRKNQRQIFCVGLSFGAAIVDTRSCSMWEREHER